MVVLIQNDSSLVLVFVGGIEYIFSLLQSWLSLLHTANCEDLNKLFVLGKC